MAAYATPLEERAFWEAMRRTDSLLTQAISTAETARSQTVSQIRALWAGFDSVKLRDGTSVPLDMAWLLESLDGTPALKTAKNRVRALLDYYDRQTPDSRNLRASLNALEKLRQDRRFQYPAATPTPPPDDRLPDIPNPSTIGDLAMLVFIGLGIALVIGLLLYLAQGLNVQQAVLPAAAQDSEDPATFAGAVELAGQSEAAGDYRNAIRYLYMASLLRLDERRLIHYDRTLTNREHLWQVEQKPQIAARLRPVVETFDRVWYGFAPVDDALYNQFCGDVEGLQELTTQGGERAATP